MHELDTDAGGFEWVDANDSATSVLSFLRKGKSPKDVVLVVLNLTPVIRMQYHLGVPHRRPLEGNIEQRRRTNMRGAAWEILAGSWRKILPRTAAPIRLKLTLPPLGALFLKPA